MTQKQNVRWVQRLDNFQSALDQLSLAVKLAKDRPLTDLEKQGLIQVFIFTHELAWNVLRDFFIYQGNTEISGSRDATREAFQKNLIEDGDCWMEMIQSRNLSSHTYNKKIANEIVVKILDAYYPQFLIFQDSLKKRVPS